MKSYEDILLDGEYIECSTKEVKNEVEAIARILAKSGINKKNNKRIKGIVTAGSEPWFVKLMF